MLGGVDGNGRFRFGGERTTGQDTLRVLWEGTFYDNSLDFTRRMTVLRSPQPLEYYAADGNSAANLMQSVTRNASTCVNRRLFGT